MPCASVQLSSVVNIVSEHGTGPGPASGSADVSWAGRAIRPKRRTVLTAWVELFDQFCMGEVKPVKPNATYLPACLPVTSQAALRGGRRRATGLSVTTAWGTTCPRTARPVPGPATIARRRGTSPGSAAGVRLESTTPRPLRGTRSRTSSPISGTVTGTRTTTRLTSTASSPLYACESPCSACVCVDTPVVSSASPGGVKPGE